MATNRDSREPGGAEPYTAQTGARLVEAVSATLRALSLTPADAGAAQLALGYAERLDEAGSGDLYDKLGSKLLTCLVELGATPRSRGVKGGASHDDDDVLTKLRSVG